VALSFGVAASFRFMARRAAFSVSLMNEKAPKPP
jgi:hypothetical protein